MDLCEPMRVQSRGGARYVLMIVDDFSRFTWIIFLRGKDDTFHEFKSFIKRAQNQIGHKLILIRTDHGTEFENSNFDDFCRKNGIDHNFSAPRTPQQNGVVERKNRTLEDMTRTMLLNSGLSKSYWAEALNTACYILNRALVRPLLHKTPYELLKNKKPNLAHLRIFGCKYFVLNNEKDNLGKFDDRSDEDIFLGYSSHSKAYKVLNKRTNCVEESIHVLFDEANEISSVQEEDFILGLTRGVDPSGKETETAENEQNEENEDREHQETEGDEEDVQTNEESSNTQDGSSENQELQDGQNLPQGENKLRSRPLRG
ncbi:hypothetical protein Dimus_038476 [Dionaea muscipula]